MSVRGVAVVGCGFQGGIHAQNVAASPDAELLWCVDVDRPRAEELAKRLGARASDDVTDVWRDPRVDVVVIATITHTHRELAFAAARHGKHLLLEKPMAISVDDCLAIEDACEKAQVVAFIGYKFRFTNAVQAAREAVPSPRVLIAETLYDTHPAATHPWVDDRSLSGGRLVSSLVHSVDLLRHLARDEIAEVHAVGATAAGRPSIDPDTAIASVRFVRGAIGSIVHGTAATSSLLSIWSFQIADDRSNATISDHGRRLDLHRYGFEDESMVDTSVEPFEAGTRELLESLLTTIDGAPMDYPGPRDGTMALLVSRCVEQSMETGQAVTIPTF